MHFSLILLHIAGATMLLLFAVHMVRTGVERAHGAALRNLIGKARHGQVRAAAGGTAMAVLLQSSTAAAMLAAGFAASGLLGLSTGLAVLLGADLGSALVVRVLSFELGFLIPLFLLAGGVMHLKFSSPAMRETGRVILGIGFVLMSLRLIGEATGPLRDMALLPSLSSYLAADYVTAFLLGAAFAWLVHSSVAAILMVATFCGQGLLPLEAGLSLVLGANLGGGLIAVWLSRGMAIGARRVPLGNLIFRAAGAAAALAALQLFRLPVEMLGASAGVQLVNFHVAFNACLLAICLPLCGVMAALTRRLLPDPVAEPARGDFLSRRVSALDRSVIDSPQLALASATRELLRMGETVEVMFRPVMDLFASGTSAQIHDVRQLDESVNRSHREIKLYIAEVNRGAMTAEQARRGLDLTDFAINLEHVGDIIAKTLLDLALKKGERTLSFSKEGWAELNGLHGRVESNMQLALNVLVSGDLASARQLVVEKEQVRRLERQSHDRHLRRLQTGALDSIETSDIHLEAVRALKEINSLLASVAYPLLTESGDLLESRLTKAA